jgi:uncharacterized membrane protein
LIPEDNYYLFLGLSFRKMGFHRVITAHQGRHLQKYIRKEAGLSRLKTHRIIARFAERGIVSLKKSGNTNEIFLSD